MNMDHTKFACLLVATLLVMALAAICSQPAPAQTPVMPAEDAPRVVIRLDDTGNGLLVLDQRIFGILTCRADIAVSTPSGNTTLVVVFAPDSTGVMQLRILQPEQSLRDVTDRLLPPKSEGPPDVPKQ